MTDLWFGVMFVLFAAVSAAVAARAMGGTPERVLARRSRYARRRCQGDAFRAVARLFDEGDRSFLRRQPGYDPKLFHRLRYERRRVLRLYLGQIRAEFQSVWGRFHALSRTSRDPEFAVRALRQRLVFHGLFAALRVQCVVAGFGYRPVNAASLLIALDNVREAIRPALEAAEAVKMDRAAAASP